MKIYAFFICFNYINVNARDFILSGKGKVPHSMNKLNAEQIVKAYKTRAAHQKGNILTGLLDEYMKPIQALKEQFPNHQLEIQLEIEREVIPKVKAMPSSKQSRRANLLTKKTDKEEPPSTTTKAPPATQTVEKKPIYAEDLQKAMESILQKLTTTTSRGPVYPPIPKAYQDRLRQAARKPPINIQPIIDLLGKGVKIQHQIPQPTDSNLNWIQIKVPKP